MRSTRVTVVAFLALLAGCAHTSEEVRAASTTPEQVTPPSPEPAPVVVQAPEDVPAARPRLTKTVTLGAGTDSQYTYAPTAPRTTSVAAPTAPTVVNNTIVVQGAPVYGGYPAYRAYGYGTRFRSFDGQGARARGTSQWSTTGWEGARRTAAPGQTPVIGGNWPTVPSYGPAPMK